MIKYAMYVYYRSKFGVIYMFLDNILAPRLHLFDRNSLKTEIILLFKIPVFDQNTF